MGGFIGEDLVRRIKEANDLVDVVSTYTSVRRAGRDHKACCPIHQERTPSLHLYDDGHYHCYGCGAHGDVISLVREMENLEFTEAVEFLARRAGIEITYQKGGHGDGLERSQRERLLALMEWATACYEKALWDSPHGGPARSYLAERGLDEATCRQFRLGWAPGQGALVRAARRDGHDLRDLLALDLALDRERGLGDRFYARLLFPICDRFGHPIAYSGRLLPEDEQRARAEGRGVGKYINSRDTPLYNKGSVVFNLHRARRASRQAGRLLVMEGQTDVMAAHQAGFAECVAALGTALTSEQARQLGACVGESGELLLLFDGDQAGRAHAVKAIKTCLRAGVPSRCAVLPESQDPAELLAAATGPEDFAALVAEPDADIDHLLRALAPRPYSLDQRARLRVIDEILDPLAAIADGELQRLYLETVATYLDLDSQRLVKRLAQRRAEDEMAAAYDAAADDDELMDEILPPPPALDSEQDYVLGLLVCHADLRAAAFDEFGCEPCQFPPPWRSLVEALIARPDLSFDGFLLLPAVHNDPHLNAACFRWQRQQTTAGPDVAADRRQTLEAAITLLRGRGLDEERKRLEHELKEAQRGGDQEQVRALFARVMDLRRQRHTRS